MSQIVGEIEALPSQVKMAKSKSRYVLYSGGVGSGKTYGLVFLLMKYVVENKEIVALACAGTWPHLRDVFYKTFLFYLPKQFIKDHNKSSHTIVLHNDSTILFRSFDDPDKIGSYTLGLVVVEELTTLKEKYFDMLRTRLRQGNQPCHFRAVCNPSGLNHWIYRRFIANKMNNSTVIYGSSFENKFLPKEYLDDLEAYKTENPEYYKRMVLGNWTTLEGLVYDLPIEQRSIEKLPQADEFIVGVDFGWTLPTAFIVIQITGETFYIVHEVYKYKMKNDDILIEANKINNKYSPSVFACDAADPRMIDLLVQNGLPAQKADKSPGSVASGIKAIQTLIGSKKLFVSENCTKTLTEFDSYQWNEKVSESKEEPIKINDHAMDALRYSIMGRNEIINRKLYERLYANV